MVCYSCPNRLRRQPYIPNALNPPLLSGGICSLPLPHLDFSLQSALSPAFTFSEFHLHFRAQLKTHFLPDHPFPVISPQIQFQHFLFIWLIRHLTLTGHWKKALGIWGKLDSRKPSDHKKKSEFGTAFLSFLPPSPLYSTKARFWCKGSNPRMRRGLSLLSCLSQASAWSPNPTPMETAQFECPLFWGRTGHPSESVVFMFIQQAPDFCTVVKRSRIST